MTLVLISAILTVYPGPAFKFPATSTESVLQDLELESSFHGGWLRV